MNRERASHYYAVVPEGVVSLGPIPLAVYTALRLFADTRTNRCWPSARSIAERAGVGRTAAREALVTLREAGWISWERRVAEDGSQTSNVYYVYGAPSEGDLTASEPEGGGSPDEGGGSPGDEGGGSPRGGGGSPGDHELITKELITSNELIVATPAESQRDDEATRLAGVLSDLLADLGVKHRVTRAWVTDLDRMMRLDGRTPDEVEGAMRWALADPFWQANIHSPRKLRAKFDQLRLTAQRQRKRDAGSPVEAGRDLIRKYEQAEHQPIKEAM